MMNDIPSPWDLEEPEEPTPPPARGNVVLRGIAYGLVATLIMTVVVAAAALGLYAYYAQTLPSPQELYQRQAPFKTTRIYDRDNRLLYEVIDPLGGRRVLVPYSELPQVLINATVATEDETFFNNPGVNPLSIVRAVIENYRQGEIVQGASTITQQVAKNLFLSPEQSYSRKIKEAILAAEITRRYSKEEILQVYLNDVYFGNLAYGVGAAAQTYFGKEVHDLALPEAALLVGMLQGPAIYDPYIDPEAALGRREVVLGLMLSEGYISSDEYAEANSAPLTLQPRQVEAARQAPHWVDYVRAELEAQFGAEALYRGGFNVYTTLDLDVQHQAEQVVADHIADLQQYSASNAALVAMDPNTGEVLAMLGSVDFETDQFGGQVNVTTRLRQPGSTIKPVTYLAAFERGWTPSTMLMDVSQSFPDGANPPYVPVNYDALEYGAIPLRVALAASRNIPAVATLNQVGIPAFLETARRLGIDSFTADYYGLSITLGGGEVTLLELTGAYAAFANGGYRIEPKSILYITDQTGAEVVPASEPALTRAMDPRHAHWMSDILSDNQARSRAFGLESSLLLSFPAAAKTGTTNDYRDNWTVGYTPAFVAGVWVGNNDNTPTDRLSGSRAAAPIWHDFMELALAGSEHPGFERPSGLAEVEICPVSGQRHTDLCPEAVTGLFLEEDLPGECQVHHRVKICVESGQLATENCPAESVVERPYEDYGPEWDNWARAQGINTPPRDACTVHSQPMRVEIRAAAETPPGVLTLVGSAEMSGFDYYYVEYGVGQSPEGWNRITSNVTTPVRDGVLARWDASTLAGGDYTLRLVVVTRAGRSYESRAPVRILAPEATATPEASPTATATLELTPTATLPLPTATATIPVAPTATATPDVSPTPAETPTATLAAPGEPTVGPTLDPGSGLTPAP